MVTDYTGASAYGDGLPPDVLAGAARYAAAALDCGLSADEIEDDLLDLYPDVLADVAAVTAADGVTLDVVLLPREMEVRS